MRKLACYILAFALLIHSGNATALGLVQISAISDLSLGTWNMGDPAVTGHIDMCAYAVGDTPLGSYGITVTTANGTSYKMVNGSYSIPYSVYWDDGGAGNLGVSNGTQLNSGVLTTTRLNANVLSVLCSLGLSGPTARLNVKIAQSDLSSALAGTYRDTITIMVSAN